MLNSTNKILQELEEEQIRHATLTKEDLKKAYFELEKENFPAGKRIKFIADLGTCKEIAYHYELICKDWEENKNLNIVDMEVKELSFYLNTYLKLKMKK